MMSIAVKGKAMKTISFYIVVILLAAKLAFAQDLLSRSL